MALVDDLISYWSMDETSGDRLDSHSGYDLTDHMSVGFATGRVGNAADLEATSGQYLTHGSNDDLQTGDVNFTFALWIRPETLSDFPIVLSKGPETGAQREYALFVDTSLNNELVWQVGTFGAGHVVTSTEGLSINTWYFVVVWHDADNNEMGLSINAGTPDVIANTEGTVPNPDELQIGASTNQFLFWDGLIDEVGFWKRVLTPAEITELYNGGNGRDYDYIANSGATDVTVDLSPLSVSASIVAPIVSTGVVVDLSPLSVSFSPVAPLVPTATTIELPALSVRSVIAAVTVSGGVQPDLGVLSATLAFTSTERATIDFGSTLSATLNFGSTE